MTKERLHKRLQFHCIWLSPLVFMMGLSMHVGAITSNGTLDKRSTGTVSILLHNIQRPIVPIPPGVGKGKGKPPYTPGFPPWRTPSRGLTFDFCFLGQNVGSKLNVLLDTAESGSYLKTASGENVRYSANFVVQDEEGRDNEDSESCNGGTIKSLSIQLVSGSSRKYEDQLMGIIKMMVTPE